MKSTVCLAMVLLFVLPATTAAQSSGLVAGVVTSSIDERPLQGAKVTVRGASLEAVTNSLGEFRIASVPLGRQSLDVTYLGYQDSTIEVDVTSGEPAVANATLSGILRESVTVTDAPMLQGQERALNIQKNDISIVNVVSADQIGRFPDPNAAEAAQRIPGVSIQRDQGEGRYVAVRGTEPRLNAMTLNGERIPSPEGDIRAVALDVIPADQLAAIVVTKLLTADKDADSIGGQVDLRTRVASPKPSYSFTVGVGYNDIVKDAIQQVSGSVGHRFLDNRLGITGGGSFLNTDRGSQNFEVEYDDGDLEVFETRDYRINRKRAAGNVTVDWQQSDTTSFLFTGTFNAFSDQEFRRAATSKIGDNEIERELKDRFEEQRIASAAFGGSHLLGNLVTLRYRTSYSYAEEAEPDAFYTLFLQEDVEFAPNVSPSSIDPDNIQPNPLNEDFNAFLFESQTAEENFTSDREATASVDLSIPLPTRDGFAGNLKFGGKVRHKTKFRNVTATDFEADDDIFLTDFGDLSVDSPDFLDGRYRNGLTVNPDAARTIGGRFSLEAEFDNEGTAEDYKAHETIGAGYVMGELYLGTRLALFPGLRFEHTSLDSTGYTVLFNDEGEFVGTTTETGDNSYGEFLPSFVARFKIDEDTNIRGGVARTLGRPNYYDLVPYQVILDEDEEILRGNPSLVATSAVNADILVERYFSTVGVASAGFFYKRLSNFIFPFQVEELRNGSDFQVIQPRNGEDASLYGIELAFDNRFRFLPSPFDGLGGFANYTYVDSNAEILLPDANQLRSVRLPGQAKHTANAGLTYEKYGFSGSLLWNFQGNYLEQVGSSGADDFFVDERWQIDLSVSQRITKNVRVFAEFVNLNDAPFRRYQSVVNRPVQVEYYSFWATFGVKLDF